MKTATLEWIAKAEEDWSVATSLARRRKTPVPNSVCYHCQQCAEKYLKARLEEAGVLIFKSHDLPYLLALFAPHEPLWSGMGQALLNLSQYAVKFRYPGHDASEQQARNALQDCRAFRKIARAAFGL
jgi:HEPN domain-containing protein